MENDSHSDGFVSAHDFDILCDAFKASVEEGQITKAHRIQHAKDLVRELTGQENADKHLISRMMRGCHATQP